MAATVNHCHQAGEKSGKIADCALAFLLAYLVVTLIARNPPSLLSLIGQIVPTLLLFPFADRMIERFEDGDVRFR